MYCLIDFCCICFYNKEDLQPLSGYGSDNITYFIKLISCVPEMRFNQMNNKRLICNKCCETMDAAYKFRQRCLRSKTTLTDYISQLHQISNIRGVANVYLTDLNKFVDIKKEYQKENNIETTEMFINVNENTIDENFVINPTIKIKRENNPITLKLIDTGNNYIQLGNVIIKMEPKNQNSDEDVEETLDNISVNQDDNKIDISQNDIKLTTSAIKKENEKQDFEERLQEKFDNILETFNSENDTAVKIEESGNYPLYSEKYFDDFVATLDEKKINIGDNDIEEFLAEDDEISLKDHDKNKSDNVKVEENNDYPLYYDYPSANLDEIKIDIVDNDIESMNNEINIQYKSEDIEEFSTGDNDLPWEDENKTDKEVKFFHKILKVKQKDAALSKNIKQKKSDIVDRKDKIIKKHKCSICKKNFSKSSHLNRHMRIHTGEKPNECDICQKKFIYPSALKQHLEIHSRVKPHECSACQKKFSYLSQLRMHTIIHTGEKPHACDVCQKKFNRLSNLMSHKRIHTGEKSHKCDVCQKKFSRLADVIRHMRIHTGEKPHKCDVCKKKFNHPSHLSKHTIIHTREKLYKCDVCQKKFTHSSSLRIHMRIHTGDKLHECDVCQKKFIWSSSLKNHMKMHDGERI